MEIKTSWYNQKHIWVEVHNEDEKVKLLTYAKEKGFIWVGGKKIKPETDDFGYRFGLNSDNQLGYVSIWCWNLGKEKEEVTVMELDALLMLEEPFHKEAQNK